MSTKAKNKALDALREVLKAFMILTTLILLSGIESIVDRFI